MKTRLGCWISNLFVLGWLAHYGSQCKGRLEFYFPMEFFRNNLGFILSAIHIKLKWFLGIRPLNETSNNTTGDANQANAQFFSSL